MNEKITLFFVFFIIFSLIFAILANLIMKRKNKLVIRLEKFLQETKGNKNDLQYKRKKTGYIRGIVSRFGKLFDKTTFVKKWDKELVYAGLPLNSGEFFAIRLFSALITILIFYFVKLHLIFLFISPIIGYFLPVLFIKWTKKKRFTRCSQQLSESLGTMANSMRAGFSFLQAMQLVAREMPDPLGPEFERALREMNYGVSMDEAFSHLLERLPDQELELVVNALLIQRSSGGNLAELLETMQETIRGRVRIKEELKTLTAQGRLSQWILTFLPVGLALYLKTVSPEYFNPILEHPIGWIMIAVATVSITIGWLVLRKIVHIEV